MPAALPAKGTILTEKSAPFFINEEEVPEIRRLSSAFISENQMAERKNLFVDWKVQRSRKRRRLK